MIHLKQALQLVLSEDDFLYIPNRGNAGDALIAESTRQVLGDLGLQNRQSARVVLVAGGGGLHSPYRCLSNRLIQMSRSRRVIILPSTVSTRWDLLKQFPNLTLMARDALTFQLAEMHGINVMAVHDAAFEFLYPECHGEGELVVRRSDTESLIGGEGSDPSLNASDLWSLDNSSAAASALVNQVGMFARIDTDRLHPAIIGAKLGMEVVLRPNSYFKNKAVFESSLSQYPNVAFQE